MIRFGVGSVEIVPGTLRDLTFIAANMRDEDWREIACQYPPDTRRETVGYIAASFGEAFVARLHGQPVAAFGAAPVTVSVISVWAFGTWQMRRVVPAVSRYITTECAPRWIDAGVTRAEARSIADHVTAHRWMRSLGAKETPLPCYGRDGEDFVLFSWTKKDWLQCASSRNSKPL